MNPVITALLARNPYPAPNIAGAYSDAEWLHQSCHPDSHQQCFHSTSFYNRVDSAIAKIDHNFNPNNMVAGRYYIGDSSQAFPFAQLAGGQLPGFDTVHPDASAVGVALLCESGNAKQVNEAPLRMEPLRGRILRRRIKISSRVRLVWIRALPPPITAAFPSTNVRLLLAGRRHRAPWRKIASTPTSISSTTIHGSQEGMT